MTRARVGLKGGTARFLVITTVSVVAACGASSPSTVTTTTTATIAKATPPAPTPSPTPDLHALGQQYLALVAPYNAALSIFNAKGRALGAQPSAAQVQAIATPLADALQTFDDTALRLSWPASVLPDIHALVTAHSAELSDLHNATASTQAWIDQLDRDAAAGSAAANVVRADLGLPPPPNGP